MKKFIFLIIPSLVLAISIFLLFQFLVGKRIEKGALQVTSLPESKVFLNGKVVGQTPLCKCEGEEMLLTGEYTLRLVPTDTGLSPFEDKVIISKSVLTVVDRRFAKGGSSEGTVITLTPLKEDKASELLVLSFPDKADVLLDNNVVGKSPLKLSELTTSDHALQIKKNGYKEKSVRIRTPQGYKLSAIIYLGVDEAVASIAASPKVASSEAALKTAKIKILETPTGFLRVRKEPSLSGSEIAQVSPGETYDLLAEETGWFKIKISDTQEGWVSSRYVEKTE